MMRAMTVKVMNKREEKKMIQKMRLKKKKMILMMRAMTVKVMNKREEKKAG